MYRIGGRPGKASRARRRALEEHVMHRLPGLGRVLLESLRDLAPLLLVVGVFYGLVLRVPPPGIGERLAGAALVLVGLAFLVRGLAMSLFPLGEALADTFARRGSVPLLLAFAFAIGFGSTVAEPALQAVAVQAGSAAAAAGLVADGDAGAGRLALLLRYTTALAVGAGVMLGCLRILLGWPSWWLPLGGYGAAALLALAGETPLQGAAFDAGAAATSAINIPLIAALGIGLASAIRGRRPLADGFGLVALASVMPMIALLLGALLLPG
jgi:hypothetical protein